MNLVEGQLMRVAKLIVMLQCIGLLLGATTASLHAEDLLLKRHVINSETDYSAAAVIDVNKDGRLDIVCGGDWYEAPNWVRHQIADIPRIGGRPDGFSHLEFDVDRDGWTDVITVNYRSRSIKWMQHPGERLGPWVVHTAVEPGPMETGRLIDIDQDGNVDLLPNGANFAAWWEFRWNGNKPGAPAWIRHDLPEEAAGHGLGFGDIDGDGRGDIVCQNGWLSAPVDRRNGNWEWHPEYAIERGSIPMIVVDPDGDGDNDIVWSSAHGFGVYWLEQTQDADGNREWQRHAIDTTWSQGHSPLWADMDGNGLPELITGKRYMAHGGMDPGEYDPIVAYRYEFDKGSRTWNRWVMSPVGDRVGFGLDPKIVDLDADGDLDLVSSGRSGLYWIENQGVRRPEVATPAFQVDESQALMVLRSSDGDERPIEDAETWGTKRSQLVQSLLAKLDGPDPASTRVALDLQELDATEVANGKRVRLQYRIDTNRSTYADLYLPTDAATNAAGGVVCMHGPESVKTQAALSDALIAKGLVCICPELKPSNGGEELLDGVWQAMRAADVLQACGFVHPERLGFVGDAMDGQVGMALAALDQRIVNTRAWIPASTAGLSIEGHLVQWMAACAPRSLHVSVAPQAAMVDVVSSSATHAVAPFELRRVPENLIANVENVEAASFSEIADWFETKFRPRRFRFSRPAAPTQ